MNAGPGGPIRRPVLLVAGAVVASCALAASAIPSPSALPGANGLVVAETRRGFVLLNGTDSSVVARIPGTSLRDTSPAFSPNGRRIAFTSNRQGESEIYVMDANGTQPQELTFRPWADDDPAWSPDGRAIAFESFQNGHFDIWVTRADGRDQRRLTTAPAGTSILPSHPTERPSRSRASGTGTVRST